MQQTRLASSLFVAKPVYEHESDKSVNRINEDPEEP